MAEKSKDYRSTVDRHIVVDPVANAIVMENRGQERVHPASLTKMLGFIPSMAAASHNDTKFGNTITIPRNLNRGGLISRMIPGGQYSRDETFARAGASSDVLATLALSHHLAKDEIYGWGGNTHQEKEQNTINHTNARLKEIGLTNTHLKNVDGRNDVGHYTTLRDLAVTMDYMATNFPKSVETALSKKVRGHHSSLMVRKGEAKWGKTGWLKATEYSHAVYVERNGKPLIVIMTGQKFGPAGARSKFARKETLKLLDKAYKIINSPDYNPKKEYEDVKFNPDAPLPTKNSTRPTQDPVEKQLKKLNKIPTPSKRPNEKVSAYTPVPKERPAGLSKDFNAPPRADGANPDQIILKPRLPENEITLRITEPAGVKDTFEQIVDPSKIPTPKRRPTKIAAEESLQQPPRKSTAPTTAR